MTEVPQDWQQQRDLIPRPDPTLLTTQQLRRELDNATAEIRREIEGTRLLLATQIENEVRRNDERHATLIVAVDQRFAGVQSLLVLAREREQDRISHLRQLHEERFAGIALQFAERDVRTEQAATASASALAAALQAAKEAVFEQAQAAAKAAEKTELSFTKQIDQIQLQIKTIGDGFSDRIAELKERIDRGEGSDSGAAHQATEHRADRAGLSQAVILAIMAISVIVSIVSVVILVAKK